MGRKLSVTPKPCSSTKEPVNVQELIGLTATFLIGQHQLVNLIDERHENVHKAEQHRSTLERDMQTSVLPDSKQAFGAMGRVG